MQRLTNKLKAELYKELGFQFKSNERSYSDILEAVNLGEKFKDVCDGLDLEPAVVEEYIKKYVLHLILEEAATLSQQEVDLTRSFSDEPLFDKSMGELLEDMQNEMQYVLSESFKSYFYETLKMEDNDDVDEENPLEEGKLDKGNESLKNLTYPFTERDNTFYQIYYRRFVDKQRPIKPRLDKDFDKENLPSHLLTHYYQFLELLNVGKDYNPTRDMLELERETDIFFLLKVWSLLPNGYLNKFKLKKDKSNYLKVLASFSLIEDLRLKLYFTEQFIKEGNSFPFIKGKGYIELFILIFLFVPLLKEYLFDNMKAPKGELSIKNNEISDKEEISKLKGIKKKLFLYHSLKGAAGYKLTDLRNESIFKIDESEISYSENFIEFYKKVKKVNGFRTEFSKDTIDGLLKIINEKPELTEIYLDYIVREFVTRGEYLALKLDNVSMVDETIRIYEDIEVDQNKRNEKEEYLQSFRN